MTQIELARRGVISAEMEFVARRENLDTEVVRSEVARGRMIIPANTVHLRLGLQPMGIGIKARCKINANIGNSAVTSNIDNELAKLKMAVDLGSDTGLLDSISAGTHTNGCAFLLIVDSAGGLSPSSCCRGSRGSAGRSVSGEELWKIRRAWTKVESRR